MSTHAAAFLTLETLPALPVLRSYVRVYTCDLGHTFIDACYTYRFAHSFAHRKFLTHMYQHVRFVS